MAVASCALLAICSRLGRSAMAAASVALLAILLAACSDDILDPGTTPGKTPGATLSGDGPFYFSFRLTEAQGTPAARATDADFVDGDSSESSVKNVLLLFYNDNNKLVYYLAADIEELKKGKQDIESTFSHTFEISLGNDEEDVNAYKEVLESAKKFITIVNYEESWLSGYKIDKKGKVETPSGDVFADFNLAIIRTADLANNNGFVMSTAGRYINDNLIPAFPKGTYVNYNHLSLEGKDKDDKVKTSFFYESKTKAEENKTTIYVERLAAKVELALTVEKYPKLLNVLYGPIGDYTEVDIDPDNKDEEFYGDQLFGTEVYSLSFTPESWGLNATEDNSSLCKNLRGDLNSEYLTNYAPGFSSWITNGGYGHRVFWAESGYYGKNYDRYASKGNEYATSQSASSIDFGYVQFKDLDLEDQSSGGRQALGLAPGINISSTYINEHTFNASTVKASENNNNNAYGIPTSVVVYGQYGADYVGSDAASRSDGETTLSDKLKSGFYLRDINLIREGDDTEQNPEAYYDYRLYLKDDGSEKEVRDELFRAYLYEQTVVCKREETTSVTDSPIMNGNTQLTDDNGKKLYYKYVPLRYADRQYFELKNTHRMWNGSKFVDAPNQFTLQLKEAGLPEEGELYMVTHNTSSNGYTPDKIKVEGSTTPTNLNAANEALQKQLGACQYFDKGKGFYYAPIPHCYDSATTTGRFAYDQNGKISYLTGQFGVVRNHIYHIDVLSISSMGFGRTCADDIPLPMPKLTHDTYHFNFNVVILPWKTHDYTFDI